MTVISDDTNVWCNQATTAYKSKDTESQHDSQDQQTQPELVEKRGSKKVQSLMAMIQQVALRVNGDEDGLGRVIRVHAPSQLLPRANWSTIHDRMKRWSIYSCAGSAPVLGGDALWQAFKRIPLKLVIQVADALPANHCVQGCEQEGWSRRRDVHCENGLTTLQFEVGWGSVGFNFCYVLLQCCSSVLCCLFRTKVPKRVFVLSFVLSQVNCLHHQCSLAKKPGLLQIDNLCSSMVRFCNAMRSSKFQDLFRAGLQTISESMDRRVVQVLPDDCHSWNELHLTLCRLLPHSLSVEQRSLLLEMFNSDWRQDYEESGSWTHFCVGCCSSDEDAKLKARECLRVLFEEFPQVPLLYRWKGWEAAQDYVAIGVLLHGFLKFLVRQCCSKSSNRVVAPEELDEDNADLSFGLKQEVRIAKTLKFVTTSTIQAAQSIFQSICLNASKCCFCVCFGGGINVVVFFSSPRPILAALCSLPAH